MLKLKAGAEAANSYHILSCLPLFCNRGIYINIARLQHAQHSSHDLAFLKAGNVDPTGALLRVVRPYSESRQDAEP